MDQVYWSVPKVCSRIWFSCPVKRGHIGAATHCVQRCRPSVTKCVNIVARRADTRNVSEGFQKHSSLYVSATITARVAKRVNIWETWSRQQCCRHNVSASFCRGLSPTLCNTVAATRTHVMIRATWSVPSWGLSSLYRATQCRPVAHMARLGDTGVSACYHYTYELYSVS